MRGQPWLGSCPAAPHLLPLTAPQQQRPKHDSPWIFHHPHSTGEGREATAGEHLGSIAHCLAINVSTEDRRDVRY